MTNAACDQETKIQETKIQETKIKEIWSVKPTYSKERALELCKKATKNDLSAEVIVNKYLLCDKDKYYETCPSDMWQRLAEANASAENKEVYSRYVTKYRQLLEDWKFVPGGRILYGLGNKFSKVTLKNCYVIAIEDDSIEGIFKTAYRMAETYKSGGGCGIDISPLRPKGSPVQNAARKSSGAVSFMELFSQVTGHIGQCGRIGALMICIDVSHPDVEDFIKIKGGDNLKLIQNANVSIKITDEFMRAVDDDKDFDLCWGGKVYKTIKARNLWNDIIYYAWKRAEPGLLFWDTTCNYTPAHAYKIFKCIATNPCGEIPLSHGDSCNLGSMNLGKYVINQFKSPEFDFRSFNNDVKTAIRFLDNVITLEHAPMAFQQNANDRGRRLGLGFMGLADLFLKMNLKFDSKEALSLMNIVGDEFMVASYDASCDLAEERGPFPEFKADAHLESPFIKKLPDRIKSRISQKGIRNVSINAIAPTGSLSIISQCSSGIEPVFQIEHIRKTRLGEARIEKEHKVYHKTASEYLEEMGCSELPDFFVEAHDIDPDCRIRLQSAIQLKIDQSISNTVNLSEETTKDKIGYYYMEAWKAGCKGITVYREGSREGILVSNKKIKSEINVHQAPKRPKELNADVHVIKPNGKTYTIFVGLLDDRIYEVFALDHSQVGVSDGTKGKIIRVHNDQSDSHNVYNFESGLMLIRQLNRYEDTDASLITRLLSTSLRHGTPLEFVIDQITKSKVPMQSFARAIARALSKYIKQEDVKGKFKCPKCNSRNVKFEGTCRSCYDCGESSCG